MGSACCLCLHLPKKSGIMGPEDTTVVRQQLGKHFSVRTLSAERLVDLVVCTEMMTIGCA